MKITLYDVPFTTANRSLLRRVYKALRKQMKPKAARREVTAMYLVWLKGCAQPLTRGDGTRTCFWNLHHWEDAPIGESPEDVYPPAVLGGWDE